MQTTINTCTIVQTPKNLTALVEQDTTHVLKRKAAWDGSNKPIFWYSPTSGRVIMPDGKRGTIQLSTDLTTLLEKIESYSKVMYPNKKDVVLYLAVGKLKENRPKSDYFQVYKGWMQTKSFSKITYYQYRHGEFTVNLYGTCNYFGEETNLELLYDAWHLLKKRLENAFHEQGKRMLLDTPAHTGRELLYISLPFSKQYPKLNEELSELIFHNLRYQGRIETFPVKDRPMLPDAYVLDGRWMYASCLSHLPVGPVYRDDINEFLGVTRKDGKLAPICPAFYHVTVTVPDNWQHIGLIKEDKKSDDSNAIYPREPGYTFSNWTTGAELALAIDNGWHVHINERIYWPDTDDIADPFATWRKNLVDLRSDIEREIEHSSNKEVLALLKDAIRSIVLHTVGNLVQVFTLEEQVIPNDAPWPENIRIYKDRTITTKDGERFYEMLPLGETRQPFIHPEMAATVYGRARAKLNAFALTLPFEDIISLRTDCVWSASLPELLDTGKPGCFRLKQHVHTFAWPKDNADMTTYVKRLGKATRDNELLENEFSTDEMRGEL